MSTRFFTFTVPNVNEDKMEDIKCLQPVVSAEYCGDEVTVEFHEEMLMEFADEIGGLGYPESEMQIYEDNVDLLQD